MSTNVPSSRIVPFLLLCLALAVAAPADAEVAVTTCNQTVANDTAVLTRNLDCGSNVSVTLKNASLELRGFTLRGNRIHCYGYCGVSGPGTHRGSILEQGGGTQPGRIVLESLTNVGGSIVVAAGQAVLRDVEVDGDGAVVGCVVDAGKVIISESTVTGGGTGICAPNGLRMYSSRVVDNGGDGLNIFGRVNIVNSSIDNNGGAGIVSFYGTSYRPGRLRIQASKILNNGTDGVSYADLLVRVTDSEIIGNQRSGMRVTRCHPHLSMGVRDSKVSDNALSAGCGTSFVCADIESCDRPRVTKTTCQTSYVAGSGLPGDTWSVCTQD